MHDTDYIQHTSVVLILNLSLPYSVTQAVTSLLTRTTANKMSSLTPEQLPVLVVVTKTLYGWEPLAVIKSKLMQVETVKSL